MFWAACSLGFFGFLCASEFTVPSLASFSPSSHLGVQDIAVDSPSAPSCMHLKIKASKTDPFRKGAFIHIGLGRPPLCAVHLVMSYLACRGDVPGPLLLFQNGQLAAACGGGSHFQGCHGYLPCGLWLLLPANLLGTSSQAHLCVMSLINAKAARPRDSPLKKTDQQTRSIHNKKKCYFIKLRYNVWRYHLRPFLKTLIYLTFQLLIKVNLKQNDCPVQFLFKCIIAENIHSSPTVQGFFLRPPSPGNPLEIPIKLLTFL